MTMMMKGGRNRWPQPIHRRPLWTAGVGAGRKRKAAVGRRGVGGGGGVQVAEKQWKGRRARDARRYISFVAS